METINFIEMVETAHQEMLEMAQPEKGNFDDLSTLRERGWLTKAPPVRKFLFAFEEAFEQNSGFLPEGKACMIASPGGCGKTFLLAHCALAAATGTEWISAKAVKPIKVLFVAAEEEEDELWNRFYNTAKGLELNRNQHLINLALDNIIALPQRGRGQRLIDDDGEPTKSYLDLKKVIEENPDIKLVILDPAARFMGADTEINNASTGLIGPSAFTIYSPHGQAKVSCTWTCPALFLGSSYWPENEHSFTIVLLGIGVY